MGYGRYGLWSCRGDFLVFTSTKNHPTSACVLIHIKEVAKFISQGCQWKVQMSLWSFLFWLTMSVCHPFSDNGIASCIHFWSHPKLAESFLSSSVSEFANLPQGFCWRSLPGYVYIKKEDPTKKTTKNNKVPFFYLDMLDTFEDKQKNRSAW